MNTSKTLKLLEKRPIKEINAEANELLKKYNELTDQAYEVKREAQNKLMQNEDADADTYGQLSDEYCEKIRICTAYNYLWGAVCKLSYCHRRSYKARRDLIEAVEKAEKMGLVVY